MAQQKSNPRQFGVKYSTSEELTGDLWIDGKPIYRKTIAFGALANATLKTVAHGITGLDLVLRQEAFAKTLPSGNTIFIPDNQGSGNNARIYVDSTSIYSATAANESGRTAWVTLWYTKV